MSPMCSFSTAFYQKIPNHFQRAKSVQKSISALSNMDVWHQSAWKNSLYEIQGDVVDRSCNLKEILVAHFCLWFCQGYQQHGSGLCLPNKVSQMCKPSLLSCKSFTRQYPSLPSLDNLGTYTPMGHAKTLTCGVGL